MYRKGIGIPQDYAAALTWFRKAADKGDASAQHALGGAYFEGLGVPQDYAAAASWYQKAADQGQINSQAVLASLYELGWGCLRIMSKPISGQTWQLRQVQRTRSSFVTKRPRE
jgi:TPR repeat protein